MRRPRVDFYHLFDENELFFAPVILIVKKFRLAIGIATIRQSAISMATLTQANIGMSTINQTSLGLATRLRSTIGISTVTRTKTQG